MPHTAAADRPADMPRTLGVIFLARAVLNYQFRLVYPFLPAISRGLGVPLETASLLLTMRAVIGATSPLYGALSDRLGRRTLMLAGLTALVIGAALAAGAGNFGVALIAFAVMGLSKAAYDPAALAYVGDVVPYERRGRVFGLLELPWAGAWLFGVPLAGFLIATVGWRAPFALGALLGLAALVVTWRLCPECGGRTSADTGGAGSLRRPGALGDALRRWPGWPALPAVSVTLLLLTANENVFIVYGAFLETQFGLTVGALGVASVVVALAELLAEGGAATLVDRLGKRRAVLIGLCLNMGAYLLLPRLNGTLGTALLGVALMFLTFEFAMVCLLSLVSEAAPGARGTALALNTAAMATGRVISSLSGPRLWAAGGLGLNAVVSAGIVSVAALILWLVVRERRPNPLESRL